jgi:2-isopropylmalate synthase
MLKNAMTYEIMTPDSVGQNASNLVLGKHSGRNAFRSRLLALGHTLDEAALNQAFKDFKTLADQKKLINDDDLNKLVS